MDIGGKLRKIPKIILDVVLKSVKNKFHTKDKKGKRIPKSEKIEDIIKNTVIQTPQ